MKRLLILLFVLLTGKCFSQDSCHLRISLLTCAPGEELYSTFGHTALRVQDLSTGTDLVYNYGTFDFNPDFYIKFIRGKLLYFLSVDEYPYFREQYAYEKRSIWEQVLLLNCDQKTKLVQALRENAKEENKYYLYDFLFDNCTTRARDIVWKNIKDSLAFGNILPEEIPSFRNLIHTYLDQGKQPWSKLGIDLLLGARLDRKVSNEEAMFLPDYLLKGFDSARINERPLVSPAVIILQMPPALKNNGLFTPALVFGILSFIIVLLSFSRSEKIKKGLFWFDAIFFLLLGLIGILLLFMWFGTDHKVTVNNYNLLWALPSHAVMVFLLRKKWTKHYFRIVFWFTLALLLFWFFLPQQMNNALLPFVILIALRSWYLSKN